MSVSVSILSIQALHGLVYGMLLFLVASGLTLVFGMMGILNLAHASFYMLGAYFAYSVTFYSGSFWWSLMICPIVVGVLGVIIERFFIRNAHKGGQVSELLLTFGLFFILGEIARIIWGTNPLKIQAPSLLGGSLSLLGVTYPIYRLFILFFSFLVLIGMALLLMKTRIGIIIRASVSDGEMVEASGINVSRVFMFVFGTGAALAGIAGVIAAPFLSIYPSMAADALMDCFVVIVIGGFGSLLGVFIASLMLGELQSFGVLWIPRLALILQFLLMAVILIVRPTGLLGEKE